MARKKTFSAKSALNKRTKGTKKETKMLIIFKSYFLGFGKEKCRTLNRLPKEKSKDRM